MKKQVDAAAFERYKQEHDRCLGIAVCQLRTEKGLTPDQLAKRAEVSPLWIPAGASDTVAGFGVSVGARAIRTARNQGIYEGVSRSLQSAPGTDPGLQARAGLGRFLGGADCRASDVRSQ